jgi:hypothetical protein
MEVAIMSSLQRVGPQVARKLQNLLGADGAEQIACEVLDELRLENLATADHRLRFGAALAGRGGYLEVLGRSIQTQALLHGAIDTLNSILR